MSCTSKDVPQLEEAYRLYENDELAAFVEAADALLDGGIALNKYDTIQLLMFAANCVEDPRDTSEYYQRARKIYRHWQDYHAPSQAPAIEKLAPKMEALRELVEEERIAWEEAQERLRDEEAESPVDEADDSENGSFQSENVDDEEHESIVADDVEKAAKDEPSGGLAYRPKSSKSQDT